MRIAEIGEFGLIARIASRLPKPGDGVVAGIGDDAAVLRASDNKYLLTSCDIQVENVHFLRDKISPQQLGLKSVAIKVSDIASMGGLPRYLTISLILPKETSVEYVDGLYEGIQEACELYGTEIVGGNMARSLAGVIVDVFLLGEVETDRVLLRSGARVGDSLLVTGSLGESAAGLALLLNPGATCAEAHRRRVLAAHLTPQARLREGRAIALSGLATAMLDVSDGTVSDIGHICEMSHVGARLWAARLPISEATRAAAEATGRDARQLALQGGEDYELLFTAPAQRADKLAELVQRQTGTAVTVIGEMVPAAEGITLSQADGTPVSLDKGGWNHFR
jgi:thiamine-monophosphate kinase